jgi:hypothetical protein
MMISRLHAGQRLWLLFATAFLASSIAVIAVAWPRRDQGIVDDLQSPACEQWRQLPAGATLDVYPNAGEPCFALRMFLIEEKSDVRSLEDYDAYLVGQRASTVLRILGGWAIFCFGFYALGWGGVKLYRKLWPKGGPTAA